MPRKTSTIDQSKYFYLTNHLAKCRLSNHTSYIRTNKLMHVYRVSDIRCLPFEMYYSLDI